MTADAPTVVIVGTGSAGRRHARAVRAARPDAAIHVVRRPSSTQPAEALAELGVVVHPTLDDVLALAPTVAVVANPAPFHREATVALLGVGARVLVEKPLAHDLADARAIEGAAGDAPAALLVGYHLRVGDTVPALAVLLAEGRIGEPSSFELTVGQHLDQWRPGTDPRESVTARHELGGGVLLELSHELDGLRALLGEVTEVSAALRHDGAPTDGRVETVADLDLVLRSGARGRVHLDMVRPEPQRRWTVTGPDGRLAADLLTGRIEHTDPSGAVHVLTTAPAGERDRAEDRLVATLLGHPHEGPLPVAAAADGVAAVALVEAAAGSARSGSVTRLP